MADQMILFITLSKEVPDREAGRLIYDLVKQRLLDRPDVEIRGHVTNHFNMDNP